ncbi:uncharacterized protein LOC110603945 [Manihot esculenta]|uniref:Uncharacterized protein n=1 Tax=Manihot esculenta TaxID=3983 RepID=A0A2C9U7T0_MANES|nr:uncharacterized protein LOC110603945 [Manihot esculenta]OAY25958.1 hypothetical protein MANES_16G010000v8 [Manihot esculenta]
MVASNPVAVGTRGTVGSLVRKEIEYFTNDSRRCGSRKPEGQMIDNDSSCIGCSRPCFWSLTLSWKRKNRRSNDSGFLPSICSAVQVAETINGIPGFSYRILKNDETES